MKRIAVCTLATVALAVGSLPVVSASTSHKSNSQVTRSSWSKSQQVARSSWSKNVQLARSSWSKSA